MHRSLFALLLAAVASLHAAQSQALPDRAKRALVEMATEMSEAGAELAEAEARYERAVGEARRDAVRDLERLAEREKDFVVKAAVYKHALAILPDDAAGAREFFTAIGTLDQVLAELEADNPVAQAGGVDLLAPAGLANYDPLAHPVEGRPWPICPRCASRSVGSRSPAAACCPVTRGR